MKDSHESGESHKAQTGGRKSSREDKVSEQFLNDPVVVWATEVLNDPAYEECDLKENFRTLRDKYVALLRRMSKITKISDAYQRNLKESNDQLTTIASKDSLTGLANRRAMFQQLETEIRRVRRHGHSLGIIGVDIDDFKQVNDTHGHEAGDSVLTNVAQALEGHLRSEDGCARWGGEEFLIALPHSNQSDTVKAAEKLRAVVADLDIRYYTIAIPVTISLGVATLGESHTLDDIIRAADNALLRAKRHGKNRVEVHS